MNWFYLLNSFSVCLFLALLVLHIYPLVTVLSKYHFIVNPADDATSLYALVALTLQNDVKLSSRVLFLGVKALLQ